MEFDTYSFLFGPIKSFPRVLPIFSVRLVFCLVYIFGQNIAEQVFMVSFRYFAILSMTYCFHALVTSVSKNLKDHVYSYLGPAVLLVPAWLKH